MYSSAYVWAKVLGYMEEQLGSVIVSTWFDDAEVVELSEEQLIIHVSSEYRRDIIRQRYQSYIKEALQEIFRRRLCYFEISHKGKGVRDRSAGSGLLFGYVAQVI